MRTLLIEIEALVNSRPLTYVHDDSDGLSYALSPSHLVYGRKISNTPNTEHFDVISTYISLTKRAKHHRKLLEHFTKFWRREYLLNLRENNATKKNQKFGTPISIGEVVILRNDMTKRVFWKLAIVQELLTGNDGQVRAAVVRVANSEKKPQVLTRSIKHLIPLEVRTTQEKKEEKSEEPTTEKPVTKSRRKAAIQGERLRRLQK